MLSTLLESSSLQEAVVDGAAADGRITVLSDEGDVIDCALLRTSDGPSLRLTDGDRVLVLSKDGATGYVLGSLSAVPVTASVDVAASSARIVEIVVPEGVETVRITGKRVRIAAEEELTLECAGGSVKIDRRGKVVVLGTDVTSRAKRLNKIKGASVAIN